MGGPTPQRSDVPKILDRITETIDLIDEIQEEYPDSWEAGEDFLLDVREKLESVHDSIERYDNCTEKQANAIKNWRGGVMRWHPDHR